MHSILDTRLVDGVTAMKYLMPQRAIEPPGFIGGRRAALAEEWRRLAATSRPIRSCMQDASQAALCYEMTRWPIYGYGDDDTPHRQRTDHCPYQHWR